MDLINQGDESNFPILQHTTRYFMVVYTVYEAKEPPVPGYHYILKKIIISRAMSNPMIDPDFGIAVNDLMKLTELMISQGFVPISKDPRDPPDIVKSYI